jgi:endoglucanase
MDFALLTQLTETAGISGREERVRDLVSAQLTKISADIRVDAMGNLIGHLPGKGPRVALMAHMDEIGFMVSKIEKEGFVRVMPVGGVDAQVFGAQKVLVHGRRELPGVVGSIPPHLRKSKNAKERQMVPPIEEGFVDLGLPPERVAEWVSVGDPVTFATRSWENETSFFGKALDDRVGLFVMLAAAQRAQNRSCDLFLIASTQEEYGLRGASAALFPIQPQIGLALEGTVASDMPGLKLAPNAPATIQGGGPEIRLSDSRMLSNRQLADALIQVARDSHIPHQVIVKNFGTTDATAMQTTARGVKTCVVSVPTRYIHAPISIARKTDIERTIDLIAAFLERAAAPGL